VAEAPRRLDRSFGVDRWKRLLAEGGRLRLRMESRDMAPAIQVGDVLEFEEARLLHLRRGDIVLVHTQGICQLRRVCSRELTRGGEVFTVAADGLGDPPRQHGFEEILARLVSLGRDGETLQPVGDSVPRARLRRRLREHLRQLWFGVLLRFGREPDSR